MIDLSLIDFASFANARTVIRSAPEFSGWVSLVVRGVVISYHVGDDLAYAHDVARGDSGSALFDFTWVADSERYEWSTITCDPLVYPDM